MKKIRGVISLIIILSLLLLISSCKNNDDFVDETLGSFSMPTNKADKVSKNEDKSENSQEQTNESVSSVSGTDKKPEVKQSENKDDLIIYFHRDIYRTVKGANAFYINATIQTGNKNATEIRWSSSNPKVATVDQNGKIVPLSTGYTIITANGKRTDNKSLTCSATTKVAVYGNDPYLNVSKKSGTLYAGDNSIYCQHFDIDFQTGDIYYCEPKKDSNGIENLTLTKVSKNGTKETMKLNGFGHGTTLEVERAGKDVYIWSSSDSGKSISRFKFEAGKTYTNNAGTVWKTLPAMYLAIDWDSRIIVITTMRANKQNHMCYIYSLDEFLKQGDAVEPFDEFDSSKAKCYTFQAIDIKGRYIYVNSSVESDENISDKVRECRVVVYDILTDTVLYNDVIDCSLESPRPESEGFQVVNENGKIVAYAAICQGGGRKPRTAVFKIT